MKYELRVEQFRARESDLQDLIDKGIFKRNLDYERYYEMTREEFVKIFVSVVDGLIAVKQPKLTFTFSSGTSEPAVLIFSSWNDLQMSVSPPPYLRKGNGVRMDLEGVVDSEYEFFTYRREYRANLAEWLELEEEDLIVNDSFSYELVQGALNYKIRYSYNEKIAISLALLLTDLALFENQGRLEHRELLFWKVVDFYITFSDGTMYRPWTHTLGYLKCAPEDRRINLRYFVKHVRGWAHHHLYTFSPYGRDGKP